MKLPRNQRIKGLRNLLLTKWKGNARELIELIDGCSDNASLDLDQLFDEPEYLQVINYSQWDHLEKINIQSKTKLTTECTFDEFVIKRKEQMMGIKDGLCKVGLLGLIQCHPFSLELDSLTLQLLQPKKAGKGCNTVSL